MLFLTADAIVKTFCSSEFWERYEKDFAEAGANGRSPLQAYRHAAVEIMGDRPVMRPSLREMLSDNFIMPVIFFMVK